VPAVLGDEEIVHIECEGALIEHICDYASYCEHNIEPAFLMHCPEHVDHWVEGRQRDQGEEEDQVLLIGLVVVLHQIQEVGLGGRPGCSNIIMGRLLML
jgi:hypothetical protein